MFGGDSQAALIRLRKVGWFIWGLQRSSQQRATVLSRKVPRPQS